MVRNTETTQLERLGGGQGNTAERQKELRGTESMIWGLKGSAGYEEAGKKQVIPKFVDGVTVWWDHQHKRNLKIELEQMSSALHSKLGVSSGDNNHHKYLCTEL